MRKLGRFTVVNRRLLCLLANYWSLSAMDPGVLVSSNLKVSSHFFLLTFFNIGDVKEQLRILSEIVPEWLRIIRPSGVQQSYVRVHR